MILFFFSRIWSWRERGGGGGSEIKQNLPLAWTLFSVAFLRRHEWDSNCVESSRSASHRRAAKRTGANRPAVSIRLSRSLGFPRCLLLASPLSGCMSGAQGRQGRSNFSPCFSFLELHSFFTESFHVFQKGQVHSKKHKLSKNIFGDDQLRGSQPRALSDQEQKKSFVWAHILSENNHDRGVAQGEVRGVRF